MSCISPRVVLCWVRLPSQSSGYWLSDQPPKISVVEEYLPNAVLEKIHWCCSSLSERRTQVHYYLQFKAHPKHLISCHLISPERMKWYELWPNCNVDLFILETSLTFHIKEPWWFCVCVCVLIKILLQWSTDFSAQRMIFKVFSLPQTPLPKTPHPLKQINFTYKR